VFPDPSGDFRRKVSADVRAVDDVSFFINEGETLGWWARKRLRQTGFALCAARLRPDQRRMLFRNPDGSIVDLAKRLSAPSCARSGANPDDLSGPYGSSTRA
jgi:ABC-type microcin C transport system duplicated ATPase subunit YejF